MLLPKSRTLEKLPSTGAKVSSSLFRRMINARQLNVRGVGRINHRTLGHEDQEGAEQTKVGAGALVSNQQYSLVLENFGSGCQDHDEDRAVGMSSMQTVETAKGAPSSREAEPSGQPYK
jgi:hypothetical protein